MYNPDKNMSKYTFINFNQVIFNNKETMKKIIGYKLKEDKKHLIDVVGQIVGINTWHFKEHSYLFQTESSGARKLKEEGVLDLWFEPVYKKEKFKVGDWVITEGYCNKYDGIALKIKDIVNDINGCFYYFYSNHPEYYHSNNFEHTYIKRKATSEEIEEAKEVKMCFGNETVIIKDDELHHPDFKNTISFAQIKRLLKSIVAVEFNIADLTGFSIDDIDLKTVKIGGTIGAVKDLRAIYKKMEELS